MIQVIINDRPITVPEGTTILEAARILGEEIPHLCSLENVHKVGACRLCVVAVKGTEKLQPSCITEVKQGMVVQTDSAQITKIRKINYELLISNFRDSSPNENTDRNSEFRKIGDLLGVIKARFTGAITDGTVPITSEISLDRAKCILCRRCVTVCKDSAGILNIQNKAFQTEIGTGLNAPFDSSICSSCSRCLEVCPTGAMHKANS